jgi:hypothetical protein
MIEDSFNEDVFVDILYNIENGKAQIKTNVRDVKDFLTNYLQAIAGDGKTDNRQANIREKYHVRVSCDLSHDTYRVSSDAGNTSLAVGIIATTIGQGRKTEKKKINPV